VVDVGELRRKKRKRKRRRRRRRKKKKKKKDPTRRCVSLHPTYSSRSSGSSEAERPIRRWI
jgi:hypothetical protein